MLPNYSICFSRTSYSKRIMWFELQLGKLFMFSCGNSFLLAFSPFWYNVLHLAKMWQNSLFRIVLSQKNLSKVSKPERKNITTLSDFYGGCTLICMVPWPGILEVLLLWILLMLREYNSKYVKALQFYAVGILHVS